MAKIAKVKKREVSVHSRAARRAASPPPKAGATSVVETDYKPWLHNAQNAGIGKKKTKQLTRQQKLRHQRGLEKADVTGAKLEKKVNDSKDRARRVQARRADWEDLNVKSTGKPTKKAVAAKAKDDVEVDVEPAPELDAAMSEAVASNTEHASLPAHAPLAVESVILPQADTVANAVDVDEIT